MNHGTLFYITLFYITLLYHRRTLMIPSKFVYITKEFVLSCRDYSFNKKIFFKHCAYKRKKKNVHLNKSIIASSHALLGCNTNNMQRV